MRRASWVGRMGTADDAELVGGERRRGLAQPGHEVGRGPQQRPLGGRQLERHRPGQPEIPCLRFSRANAYLPSAAMAIRAWRPSRASGLRLIHPRPSRSASSRVTDCGCRPSRGRQLARGERSGSPREVAEQRRPARAQRRVAALAAHASRQQTGGSSTAVAARRVRAEGSSSSMPPDPTLMRRIRAGISRRGSPRYGWRRPPAGRRGGGRRSSRGTRRRASRPPGAPRR